MSQTSDRQPSPLRPRIFPHGNNDLTLPASGYLTRSTRRNCRRSPIPTKNRPSCRARWAQLFFPFSNRQKSCPGEISARRSALTVATTCSFSVAVELHRSSFYNYEVVNERPLWRVCALVSTCARLASTWWWVEGLASTCRVAGFASTYTFLISGRPSLPQAVPYPLRGG